jgi:hypothetical protein
MSLFSGSAIAKCCSGQALDLERKIDVYWFGLPKENSG